jgi:hypothetical protein
MNHAATFSNGVAITRKSEHEYTHAWAIFDKTGALVNGGKGHSKGFSRTAADAFKAAHDAKRRWHDRTEKFEVVAVTHS